MQYNQEVKDLSGAAEKMKLKKKLNKNHLVSLILRFYQEISAVATQTHLQLDWLERL